MKQYNKTKHSKGHRTQRVTLATTKMVTKFLKCKIKHPTKYSNRIATKLMQLQLRIRNINTKYIHA